MKFIAMALAAAAMAEGSACAMTQSPTTQTGCRVRGGDRLAERSGGVSALCAAIDQALAGRADVRSVEVTIASAYRASAVVTKADGTALPAVHVAMSDSALGKKSFTMLADAIVAKLKNQAGN